MKLLRNVLLELYSLFVDDGSLAFAVLLWVGLAALIFPRWPAGASWHAPLLCLGVALLFLENVWRSARRR
jgi:hypothetical protein